jgi:EmrB/QacA subfamily drug resistance transporter
MRNHRNPNRTGVLASMCLALVLVVASVSSVNVTLTAIGLDLGASSTQLTWIADGYTVALAALVLPFGALGDRFGRRRLLLAGTVLFGGAAAAAALAGSAGTLIGCRVAMGIGAAMIMPGTLSTITAVFPPDRRQHAVSVWAGFAASGAVLGLLASGTVLEWYEWPGTFALTAGLALVSLVASLLLAPESSDPDDAPLDPAGSVLSAVGVGAVVFGVIEGAEHGWTQPGTVLSLAIAAASLAGFVLWELHTERPMLDVRLFGLRGFTTGTLGITIQFLATFGVFFVTLQYLQLMRGYSPLHSAVCLLPLAAVVMPLSRLSPRIVERLGYRAVITTGLVAMAGGLALLSRLDADSGYPPFLLGLVVFGLGMALTGTPSTSAIVSSLPAAKQGVASAMNDVSREVGAALGIALLGSLFNRGYSDGVADAASRLPAGAPVHESAGAGLAVASRLGEAGTGLADAVRDAFTLGMQDAMLAAAAVAAAGAVLVAWRAPARSAAIVEPRPAAVEPEAARPLAA